MLTIYIVRHGEAEGNVFRRVQGRYNSYLTANGLAQLNHLKKRFAAKRLDAVYSSDLRRAFDTAKAVVGDRHMAIMPDPRLREMHYGEWEDLNWGEVAMRWPEIYHSWQNDCGKLRVPGGESNVELGWRVYNAVAEIAAREYDCGPNRTIALASHGTAIRAFTALVKQQPFSCVTDGVWAYNTAVMKLCYEPQAGLSFVYENDVSHMPPEMNSYVVSGWWQTSMERNMYFLPAAPCNDTCGLLGEAFHSYKGRLSDFGHADDITGFISTYMDGETLVIERMALMPQYRNFGCGAVLLGHAVSKARKNGAVTIRALTHDGISKDFFVKWGFTCLKDGDEYIYERPAGESHVLK